MAQNHTPPVTVLAVPALEPESTEEREVDELLDSEEVAGDDRSLAHDPATIQEFQRLWRKTWPSQVVDEWVRNQTEPCIECRKRFLRCETKSGAVRCIPCARARRGPCSRWRAFQLHQIGVTLKLSPAVTEVLAQQPQFSNSKILPKMTRKTLSKHTPALPSSMPSSMRFLQRTSRIRRSRSPQVASAPAADDSEVDDKPQTAAQSASRASAHLRIKLPAPSCHFGRWSQEVGGSDLEEEHRSSIASRSAGDLPQSPPRTPGEPVSLDLPWSPDGGVAQSISMALPEPSYEPPPAITPSELPTQSPPGNSAAERNGHSPRSAGRSLHQADITARDAEISSLRRELAAREREIASLRQQMQTLNGVPNPPPQRLVGPSSQGTPISENESSTRRYLALQYIARTLKGARESNTSEEREALLVRAEHHLARLANLEMEGIWKSDVDADEMFASLARDNWDDRSSARKRRRMEG
ncbi:hypothetical protein PAXRUDRAFT_827931 [Paxillus rubicundulus Ve08.2h10]|uniref:Uncharacterized protein n=1 Tax=Paxillus rubicundulus Ve08.2h10 TaxID=930991 RepID=A0A0D0E811_9AGAM|nr:hypothetical protein PAXRUDRAFT_827931 [Paxillus rubicundulus Ve08.2h10]